MHPGKSFCFLPRRLLYQAGLCWLVAAVSTAAAQVAVPILEIHPPPAGDNWMRLSSSFHPEAVLTLEASADLESWQRIGTLHDALHRFPDPEAGEFDRRFYRLFSTPRAEADDWKNGILFPEESFRSTGASNEIRWVKFAILTGDPARVVYQDSAKYPFHYDFASRRIEPFLNMSPAEFDTVSLRRTNQQVVLGAVLYPPRTHYVEYGVQFVGLDPYTPDEIGGWFDLVTATIHAAEGAGAFYMPVFEQSEVARAREDEFEARGIPVDSIERWLSISHIYSPGWALGRLKYFAAAEIDLAFSDGRLGPGDILLTDGVPAETPLVAGIISLAPSTPNSHTAILARTFGVPFVYLVNSAERNRVERLDGRLVILRAVPTRHGDDIKVLDVEGTLDPQMEEELLTLKQPEPIEFLSKETYGAISEFTDVLTPADIRFFGGKAANYGLLRESIPDHSPPAIAFSFDLWDAFLDQTLPGGQTLRAEIGSRLAHYTEYPPDIAALKYDLAVIRSIIRQTAEFTETQEQEIVDALGIFDPARRIRFRSSTNIEDSEHFTGAGLYDSYSGCLLDDLDGDSNGPSWCDPDQSNERGVFRAIKRVYASFYNDNAFLERLRHGVDESRVGMAVLVHHSFPDEEELANGVATLRAKRFLDTVSYSGNLVTQLGAESVTNPDGTSVPEVVAFAGSASSVNFTLTRRSSLVPLGAHVMEWESDYRGFFDLFRAVSESYSAFYPEKVDYYLDLEYKKDVNLGLVVKQVRELPRPATTLGITPFLINEPTTYCIHQGEAADVFSNHRLKSSWLLETRNVRMTKAELAGGIYSDSQVEYIANDTWESLSGPPVSWPDASISDDGSVLSWITGRGAGQRLWTLQTTLPGNVTGSVPPVFTQRDFAKRLSVTYPEPLPTINSTGDPATTITETVVLELCRELAPGALLQERAISAEGDIAIETSFYWPRPAEGAVAGYTAPLVHFVETRITGLTTAPIVLTGYYSQTYRPGHHNFFEEFIFEPRLEPGMPAATLAELEAANVHLVWARVSHGSSRVRILGLDQIFRDL